MAPTMLAAVLLTLTTFFHLTVGIPFEPVINHNASNHIPPTAAAASAFIEPSYRLPDLYRAHVEVHHHSEYTHPPVIPENRPLPQVIHTSECNVHTGADILQEHQLVQAFPTCAPSYSLDWLFHGASSRAADKIVARLDRSSIVLTCILLIVGILSQHPRAIHRHRRSRSHSWPSADEAIHTHTKSSNRSAIEAAMHSTRFG
jgi:hypothetical protein